MTGESRPRQGKWVSLIGMRGAGKSVVGRALATRTGGPCIDLDAEIVSRCKASIAEIFARDGEAAFRRVESEILREVLTRDASATTTVLATGGGVVLDPDNVRLLRDAGPVIWLRAAPAVLASRIAGDPASPDQRPALTGLDGAEELKRLAARREPCYRAAADAIIDTDSETPDDVARRIASMLTTMNHGPRGG